MSLRRLRKTTRKSNSRRLRGGNTEQQLRQRLDIVTDQRDVARDAANDWQAKFNEWFARATRAEQKLARAEQALAVVDDLSYRLFLDSGSIAKQVSKEGMPLLQKIQLDVGRVNIAIAESK